MKELGTKTLNTERLILRKYKLSDANDMYQNWGSDSKCNIYLPWELHKNINETKELLNNWIESYKDDKFKWVVELKEDKIAIGGIDIVRLDKKNNICEIGYCIGSKFWSKGYITEALKKILEYLFNECGLYLIEAYHHKSNIASGKVMEKVGMTKECELRNRGFNKATGKLENLICYSITIDEFKKLKKGINK